MTKIIRTNLAYLRLVRGKLTQRAIADATGIGQKTLSALETGTSKGIEFSTLAKLCTFLQCTPSDLLVLEDEPEKEVATKEALTKADELIKRGLQKAMESQPKTTKQVWDEFDQMRSRLRSAAEKSGARENDLCAS